MTKNKTSLARLVDLVWREPKGKIGAKVRKVCDEMPHKQRLMVVTILLSAFVLIAFFVFGNACYKMGARRAVFDYEVEHLYKFDLPEQSVKDAAYPTEILYNETDSTYDHTGMESKD